MNDDANTDKAHSLIPTNTKLQEKPSSLVKRGLEFALSMQSRSVSFPANRAVGMLFIKDPSDNSFWEEFKQASGRIIVPPGKEVKLSVEADFDPISSDLSFLAVLNPDDLQGLQLPMLVTPVVEAGMSYIKGLSGLKELDLTCTMIGDAALANIQRLTGLKELNLMGTKVTDAGMESISELTNLECLSLRGAKVTDAGLVYIRRLTNLRELGVDGTGVTDAGLAHLQALPEIQSLRLGPKQISSTGLVHLQGLPKLNSIMVGWGAEKDNQDEIEGKLKNALPNCHVYSIRY